MDCEVCGNRIEGKPFRSIIGGVKLLVCLDCSKFSTSTWKNENDNKKMEPSKKISTEKRQVIEEDSKLVDNYGSIIKKAREKLNLTHKEFGQKIGEKSSVIQKIETKKMVPDSSLLKKIERSLDIKLVEPMPKFIGGITKGSYEPTLGEIAIVRGKKNEDDKYTKEKVS